MRNIWTIAWKEFKLYFSTPIFYIISAMIFLFLGIIFYANLAQVISAARRRVPRALRKTCPAR